jgi:hypothetical protein
MSTEELIVQSFEWLADYSQHYAESCLARHRTSSVGSGVEPLETRSYDRGFNVREQQAFRPVAEKAVRQFSS